MCVPHAHFELCVHSARHCMNVSVCDGMCVDVCDGNSCVSMPRGIFPLGCALLAPYPALAIGGICADALVYGHVGHLTTCEIVA